MSVAIIPARGGSKRIPRKNIKDFGGRPMIAHSIVAALESGCFDRVLVSTDDPEIAEVARQWGADVPFMRPAELSDDTTATAPVILHALEWLEEQGSRPDEACCIYATAPFLKPRYLREGLEILRRTGATTAFSVTTFAFPIFRSLKVDEAGVVSMFWPEHRLTRSQDLPEAYHDAGQFYWLNTARFVSSPNLYAADSQAVILPRRLVQDIDTQEDWEVAIALYEAMSAMEGKST
jgi:pseudaminic acid CMP-transferase